MSGPRTDGHTAILTPSPDLDVGQSTRSGIADVSLTSDMSRIWTENVVNRQQQKKTDKRNEAKRRVDGGFSR